MRRVHSAIPRDCPRCGAPLPAAKDGRTICKYCRNIVHVELPPTQHPAQRSAAFPWLKLQVVWSLAAALCLGGWQVYRMLGESELLSGLQPSKGPAPDSSSNSSSSSSERSTTAPIALVPASDRVVEVQSKLLLINAVNEVHQDCLAIARLANDGRGRSLVAFNGRTGRVLWRHAVSKEAASGYLELATTSDSVLLKSQDELLHLRAKDGSVVWRAKAKTEGTKLCSTQAYVALAGATAPTSAWDWKGGNLLQVKPGSCEPLYSTFAAGPNFDYADALALGKLTAPTNGFTPLRGLIPHQGNARVVLGNRTSNASEASVPEVGVVINRRWVWQREVSEHTIASFTDPPQAAVRRENVVVPYWDAQNKVLRLAAFELGNGKRRWDISLGEHAARRSDSEIDVVLSLDGAVFAKTPDGQLSAYTLSTGTALWSLDKQ